MIGSIVYLLCGALSLLCTFLLWRRYQATRTPLLFWSGGCFLAFTVTNMLLFIDLVLVPGVSLALWRLGISVFGVCLLLYGIFRTGGIQ